MENDELQSQVDALQSVILAIIVALANRDRDLAREIVSVGQTFDADGNGNVVALHPEIAARLALHKQALDTLLHDIRRELGTGAGG
ncbi:MAG: hypothetical protein F4092_16235 [Rhodospirillaceae bacterium]|nr:hypothetical protein [Rhodospirillaceae bacterium]MYJ73278.1 hypothetical protein [Rhodospirillaceae bacterium]